MVLLVSNIISVTFPKLCQAPSGFSAQSLSRVHVSTDRFDIQLAKLQVHNETISTQPIRHEEAPALRHLQPKPPPEPTKPEQSHKPNHTFVRESKSMPSPPGYGLKAGPAGKHLHSAQSSQFVQNQAIAGCQTNSENKAMNQTRGKSKKVWLRV